MSDLLDVDQVRAMATPAGSLWAGERAPTALALARTALDWFARWSTVHAAEEARDFAFVERDEAYRQRDEAKADLGTVRAQLSAELADAGAIRRASGAKSGEPTIMAVDRTKRWAKTLKSQINDARAILGARPDELLSDAAKRVARSVESVYPGPQVLRGILGAAEGQGVIPAARAVVAELQRLRAERAEIEPPQTFRPPITVTIHNVTGHTSAEVSVGDITDPAFLALPMGTRLGLVVLRG